MTRERFIERYAPLAEGLLDGAHAHAVFAITGKHTVFPVDNRGYQVALLVDIGHSLRTNHFASRWCEVVPHLGEQRFEQDVFLLGNRSPGIAFDATGPTARGEVTHKFPLDHIETDKHIAYLQHTGFFVG